MYWIAIVLIVLGCLSCEPAPPPVEREVTLQSCGAVTVRGNVQIQARTGTQDHLLLVGPSAFETEMTARADGFALSHVAGDSPVHATLTCREWGTLEALGAVQIGWDNAPAGLHKLALYGASTAVLAHLDGEQMDLRAAGAARMQASEILTDHLLVMLSGASEMALAGSTTALSVEAAGSSKFDASALQAQKVVIDARGAALLDLWATAHLSGSVSAQVQLNVRGNPDRDVTRSQPR